MAICVQWHFILSLNKKYQAFDTKKFNFPLIPLHKDDLNKSLQKYMYKKWNIWEKPTKRLTRTDENANLIWGRKIIV